MAIKSKAKASGDAVEVKVLMKHDMETGLRKDSKTGELIPAHHITEVLQCTMATNLPLQHGPCDFQESLPGLHHNRPCGRGYTGHQLGR